ncbi:cytochrome P-450 cyp509A1 [Halteromyces radiatus]|uniref:cytochrome P-450 cyp509A1 n=1 Tax=Halteromyces radiatus TaxID=101107 RepID=UPI0022208EC7|nr:cytochrome P-450 cyp509A1 [Halteromyces radiatus]KAI8093084.1 cytochrome P-450 cyp509A1 [Halteromyces radiatus]
MYVRYERSGWTVHMVTPEAAKTVFNATRTFPKLIDESVSETLINKILDSPNVMNLNVPRWKDHRSVVNPAFNRALPIQLFGETTQKLFRLLDIDTEQCGTHTPFKVDVADVIFRWSLDVMGLASFGFNFEGLSKKENPWAKVYKQFDKDVKVSFFSLYPILDQQLRWLFRTRQAAHENLERYRGMVSNVVQEKRPEGIENDSDDDHKNDVEKDLLTLMIESELRGEGAVLSNQELVNNLCIFFAAGLDTTANALSFALFYLAKNPDIQEKARQEVIRVLCPDGKEPTEDVLPTAQQTKELQYILQVVKETLRFNGSVAWLVTPRVVAQDDTVLMGQHIPKGTSVSVNIYDLHHNPNVWKDPEVFNPDRFAPGGEADNHPNGTAAWIPFGFGSRKCIGYRFSMGEQVVLLSMLLRKYIVTLPSDTIHKEHIITNNVQVINPVSMEVLFKRRY